MNPHKVVNSSRFNTSPSLHLFTFNSSKDSAGIGINEDKADRDFHLQFSSFLLLCSLLKKNGTIVSTAVTSQSRKAQLTESFEVFTEEC